MSEEMHFARTGCIPQEPFQYLACGLDNIYLTSGYVRKQRGGHWMTSIEDADGLHRAIARHLVLRRKQLSGRELRFLRKNMELTQAELAQLFGVTDQTVARYEKGESEFTGAADMLLRLLVVGHLTGAVDPIKLAEEIRESDDVTEDKLVLEHDDVWKIAA